MAPPLVSLPFPPTLSLPPSSPPFHLLSTPSDCKMALIIKTGVDTLVSVFQEHADTDKSCNISK